MNQPRFPFSRRRMLAMLAAVAPGAMACSSDDDECAFEDVDVPGRDVNPDGVPYPTDGWGANPRYGTTPGDRIPNFTFRGFPDSRTGDGLQTVSLADYYDPSGTRVKLLHLIVAAMWCPICAGQTKEMVQTLPSLRQEGVVSVQALVDGPKRGAGPDRCDLDNWVERHQTNFTLVADVGARRIAEVVQFGAVPFNALMDARTMEILDAGLGAPLEFAGYVRFGLDRASTG